MNTPDRATQLLGDNPPVSRELFHEKVWSVYGRGNPVEAYIAINLLITSGKRTFTGQPITFELISAKWLEYITYCVASGRSGQYIRGFAKWLELEEYNGSWDAREFRQQIELYTKPNRVERPDQSPCGEPEPFGDDFA